jgi:hypothetical protein
MRLGTKGLFYGTIAKYLLAAYGGLITMPPELATIETVAINHTPIPYHDMLYEFLEYGFGTGRVTMLARVEVLRWEERRVAMAFQKQTIADNSQHSEICHLTQMPRN